MNTAQTILSKLKACRKLAGGKAASSRRSAAKAEASAPLRHPEGMPEISRGLSESDTPGMQLDVTTLKGWQNRSRKDSRTPSGCNDLLNAFRGYHPLVRVQPPANFWQPFRLLQRELARS